MTSGTSRVEISVGSSPASGRSECSAPRVHAILCPSGAGEHTSHSTPSACTPSPAKLSEMRAAVRVRVHRSHAKETSAPASVSSHPHVLDASAASALRPLTEAPTSWPQLVPPPSGTACASSETVHCWISAKVVSRTDLETGDSTATCS